jgi:hypothetical protein
MYEKTEQRRKLGMMARSIVQKSFGGERYLREHEQMLWIGKACHEMLGLEKRVPPPKNPARVLSLRSRTPHTQQADTASSNIIDTQLEKMQHPRRPYAQRHHSAATSFSSVYVDPPSGSSTYSDPIWELEEWDHDVDTPESSIKYTRSERSEEAWPLSGPPVMRPLKAHSRGLPAPIPIASAVARGKRPVHQPTGYDAFEYDSHIRSERAVPKADPRRSVLVRQSLAYPESGRSSLRTRSHLNEMEIAEYGNVDGRL